MDNQIKDEANLPTMEKTLYITSETKGFDYKAILGQVIQYVNMGDVLAKIQVGMQYVVQIPTEFQSEFESGEYCMMQNQKTGKLWPLLIRVAENGRNQVVTPLPISEQGYVKGNPVQDLAVSYHNILMQQQIARLTNIVEDTYRIVERIEHGQMDDRIGRLEAGKNGLLLALSMPDGEERTIQISSSRQNLLVAQAQIGKTLQRRVAEFEALPKSAPVRFFKELVHSGYLAKKDKEVSEMQEYYDLYLQATKLIAASYAMRGNLQTAEESFKISEQFVGSIDFGKVKSIENIHPGLEDMFYAYPVDFITSERTAYLEEAKAYDYVALEVSGEVLLEALSDERSKKVSEEIPKQ